MIAVITTHRKLHTPGKSLTREPARTTSSYLKRVNNRQALHILLLGSSGPWDPLLTFLWKGNEFSYMLRPDLSLPHHESVKPPIGFMSGRQ